MQVKEALHSHSSAVKILLISTLSVGFVLISLIYYNYTRDSKNQIAALRNEEQKLKVQLEHTIISLKESEKELHTLKSQDQYVINKKLEEEIKNIQRTYKNTISSYENLLRFKELASSQKQAAKTIEKFDSEFTKTLTFLSQRNYASAEATLADLEKKIEAEKEKFVAQFTIPPTVPTNNAPPASGYARQQVQTGVGNFLLDIISADLSSTKVIVDTASDSDCHDNCPVLSLTDYVARNGAFAGVNGSYFCPTTYPSCAGKTNSFDTLLMNKNKVYFNSENNVYSTVPAVIFGNGWIRFVGQSLEWGRDTSVDSVIANQPLLLANNNVVFGGDDDPKKGSRGGRSFVGNKGNTVYIGVVHNATVAESAHALKTLGLDNALNLDNGGSTALWFSGFKAGPGRNIPNAVLFVKR